MFVLVNPAAGGGRAVERWAALEPEFRDLVSSWPEDRGPLRVEAPGSRSEARRAIRAAFDAGERWFVAAGGDGTVNALLSALTDERSGRTAADGLLLGAVGLGSSNDFHKPLTDRRSLRGAPIRVDPTGAVPHDVGRVRYRDAGGALRSRPWIVNASVGLTADANARFNDPDALLRILKPVATGPAIAYAAARTVAAGRIRTLGLRIDGAEETWIALSNLAVVKNPHFAGCLRYDSPFVPADGRFHVHLLEATGVGGRLAALAGLALGRFTGRAGTRSTRASRLSVRAREPFALEVDGEVDLARSAVFTLSRTRVRVCR